MSESFQDRMFLGSEAVYAAIETGQDIDVTAELIRAQAEASADDGE